MGCVECVHPQKPCPGLDAETGGDGEPRGTSPRVFLLPSTGAPKPAGSPSCPHPPRPARRREWRPVWRRRGPRVPAAPCALCLSSSSCYPQGCEGLARGPRLPLRCPRKQCRCGSCRQGPRASSGPRGSGSVGPSPPQSAEGPQGPHCPAQLPRRKAASRQRGARPLLAGLGPRGRAGPSAGHMASERSRNEMQPKAGPKTQRDLGVLMPSSHPKETGKAGCLGGPQLAGPGSCPRTPAELP